MNKSLSKLSIRSLHRILLFVGVATTPELNHEEMVARAIANQEKFWKRIRSQMVHQFPVSGSKSLEEIGLPIEELTRSFIDVFRYHESRQLTNAQLDYVLSVGLKIVHAGLSEIDLIQILMLEDSRVDNQLRYDLLDDFFGI